jgi:hypothetical protein
MADLYSLVSSCQRHGHDPFAYLRDVMTRLAEGASERTSSSLLDTFGSARGDDWQNLFDGRDRAKLLLRSRYSGCRRKRAWAYAVVPNRYASSVASCMTAFAESNAPRSDQPASCSVVRDA